MSTPTQHPVRKPLWKRALTVVGTVLIVFLVLRGLGSLIDDATGLDKDGYSAPSPAATQSQPVTTPEEAQVAAGAPPAEEYTPPAPVEPEGSYFGGEDSMVASVEVMDDDVLIVLKTHSQANATKTHAPYVLQEAIDNLTGSEHAPQIDLVAVYSSDGVMVASDRIPGGKWS